MPDRPPPERRQPSGVRHAFTGAMWFAVLGFAAVVLAQVAIDLRKPEPLKVSPPHGVAQFCQGPDLFLAVRPQGAAQAIAIMIPEAVECAGGVEPPVNTPSPEPLEFH